jgi:hypothetical protein
MIQDATCSRGQVSDESEENLAVPEVSDEVSQDQSSVEARLSSCLFDPDNGLQAARQHLANAHLMLRSLTNVRIRAAVCGEKTGW